MKARIQKTISWYKYRSEITTLPKNNNFDFMIDPTFRNINGLFLFSFKAGANSPAINVEVLNAISRNERF